MGGHLYSNRVQTAFSGLRESRQGCNNIIGCAVGDCLWAEAIRKTAYWKAGCWPVLKDSGEKKFIVGLFNLFNRSQNSVLLLDSANKCKFLMCSLFLNIANWCEYNNKNTWQRLKLPYMSPKSSVRL